MEFFRENKLRFPGYTLHTMQSTAQIRKFLHAITRLLFTCSKPTIEALEKGMKYIQS